MIDASKMKCKEIFARDDYNVVCAAYCCRKERERKSLGSKDRVPVQHRAPVHAPLHMHAS